MYKEINGNGHATLIKNSIELNNNKYRMIGTLYSSKYNDTIYDIIPISFDNIEINRMKRQSKIQNNDYYNSIDNSHIINIRDPVKSSYCGLNDELKLFDNMNLKSIFFDLIHKFKCVK